MRNPFVFSCVLLLALALRPSRSEQSTAAGEERHNATAASSAEERAASDRDDAADNGGHVDRRYVRDDDGGGVKAAPDDGRVAELYDDLEDSVVFEDSTEAGETATSAEGRSPDQQRPTATGRSSSAAASAEEYDDAAPAGSSPAAAVAVHRQQAVKYPEYVRSSSYRRGNVTRPEELFRFWDPYEWTATAAVSDRCAEHMEQYRAALRDGNMWAFKSK